MKAITLILFLFTLSFSSFVDEDKDTEDIMKILSSEKEKEINYFTTKLLFQYIIPLSKYSLGQSNKASCTICKAGATAITSLITKESIQSIYHILYSLCEIVMAKGFCEPVISSYADVMVEEILNYMKNTEDFCTKLGFCEYSGKYLDPDAYANKVLADKPKKEREPIDESAPQFSFVSLNDAHYDPYYKEGTKASMCGYSICCREYDDRSRDLNGADKAGKFGFPGACDTNEAMFDSFLDKVDELKPDFIIWNGDNTPHDV
ncbi:MAG: hypothetical protein MJ252_06575 [archaeon]|nr:hypothetical protein [archaeon]